MATAAFESDDIDIIIEETRMEDVISSSRSISENQAALILQDDQSIFVNRSDVIELLEEGTVSELGESSEHVTSEILNEIIDLTFGTGIASTTVLDIPDSLPQAFSSVIISDNTAVDVSDTDELIADSRSEVDAYIHELIDSLVAELVNESPVVNSSFLLSATEVPAVNEVSEAEIPTAAVDINDMSLELTFIKLSVGVVREQCLDVSIEAMLEIKLSLEEESNGKLSIFAAAEPIVLSTLSPRSTKETFHRAASIIQVEKVKSPTKIVVQSSHSVANAAATTSVYEFPEECINAVADNNKEIENEDALNSTFSVVKDDVKIDVADTVVEQNAYESSTSEPLPVLPSQENEAVETPLAVEEEPPKRGPPVPLARFQSFEDDTIITSEMIADRKAAKLKQLRYANKEPPTVEPTPQEVPPVDIDIANMMKSTTARLKAFDYSKIRGSKLGGRAPPPHHRPPGKPIPKTPTRDLYRPPANFFYEYEDLVRINQDKVYYNLNEKELETYLTTVDFERVFSMTRVNIATYVQYLMLMVVVYY